MTVTNKSRGSPRFHGSSGDVSPRGVVDIPAGIRNRPGAPYGRSDGISHSAAKLGSEAAQGAPGDLAEPGGPAGLPFVQIVAMFLAIYLPERPTTRIAGIPQAERGTWVKPNGLGEDQEIRRWTCTVDGIGFRLGCTFRRKTGRGRCALGRLR